jgi:hypothetical protein
VHKLANLSGLASVDSIDKSPENFKQTISDVMKQIKIIYCTIMIKCLLFFFWLAKIAQQKIFLVK